MKDQARTLRRLAWLAKHQNLGHQSSIRITPVPRPGSSDVRVISFTSGKGGVGKTHIVVNLAYALQHLGARVMILDADLGLANVDVLLGLAPRYTLQHVIEGQQALQDVLIEGPAGMLILPTGSGKHELTHLTKKEQSQLLSELDRLNLNLDFLLVDTGAGISTNVMCFNTAAHDIIVVVTPEPTSLTDAYTLMKIMTKQYNKTEFKVVINTAATAMEAEQAFDRISLVTEQFLNLSIEPLGLILRDVAFTQAVRQQKALLELYPDSEVASDFHRLAQRVLELPAISGSSHQFMRFWKELLTGQAVPTETDEPLN